MAAPRLHLHVLIDALGWGGAETLLADFVAGAREANMDISVAHLHGLTASAGRLRELGIEPVRVPIDSLLGRSDRRALREHLAQVGPDLLHTHLGYSDLLGGLAARSLGIPSVSTIHIEDWSGERRERLKLRLMAMARRHCAQRVIAVSESARRAYLQQGWDRPERVVAVHNGIIDRTSLGAGARVRHELGIADDELVLAMVSVLRPEKGHRIAAAAMKLLLGRFDRLRLLILGEGPERAEIERLVSDLGDRAILAGHRDDVLAVLDAVDVLIHPSRTDAFPTTLLEAMAAGVPSVATAVGGIPEILDDGETGLLIPPPPDPEMLAAATARLLDDRQLRMRIGARGRERFAERFTVDRWLERLMPVYESALEAVPPGARRRRGAVSSQPRRTAG